MAYKETSQWVTKMLEKRQADDKLRRIRLNLYQELFTWDDGLMCYSRTNAVKHDSKH